MYKTQTQLQNIPQSLISTNVIMLNKIFSVILRKTHCIKDAEKKIEKPSSHIHTHKINKLHACH